MVCQSFHQLRHVTDSETFSFSLRSPRPQECVNFTIVYSLKVPRPCGAGSSVIYIEWTRGGRARTQRLPWSTRSQHYVPRHLAPHVDVPRDGAVGSALSPRCPSRSLGDPWEHPFEQITRKLKLPILEGTYKRTTTSEGDMHCILLQGRSFYLS